MGKTSIQWAEHSINPLRARDRGAPANVGHHCEKVSPGCLNCYASRLQSRFGLLEFGGPSRREEVSLWLDSTKLAEVLRRKKPTRYFWCDMTDLFGEWVELEWIARCVATMALTPWHTHLLLTKRPQQMRRFFGAPNCQETVDQMAFDLSHGMTIGGLYDAVPDQWPLPNVWLGVSVEDQQRAGERIPLLLQTPAAVRFLSAEPLLGPIDLEAVCPPCAQCNHPGDVLCWPCPDCKGRRFEWPDWVILGGESGPGARPCDLAWLRSLVAQCRAASVPAFVKQLGRHPQKEVGERVQYPLRLRDPKGGDLTEFPPDLRIREFPEVKHA